MMRLRASLANNAGTRSENPAMNSDNKQLVRLILAAALGGAVGSLAVLVPSVRTEPSRPMIAFIPRTTGANFAEDMHRGAEAAAERAGYQLYWNAPTRADDVDRQIRIAQKAVDNGAKALILAPTNPWGVTTLIDSLTRQKIPVVIVQTESPVPTGPYVTSIVPDQAEFGRIAAERIAAVTGGSGQVAVIGLDRGKPETLARAQSFIAAMKAHPEIDVVAQSSGSIQTLEDEQSTREILNSYPDLKALFAVSADAAQSALLVLQDTKPDRKIPVVGCDRDWFLADDLLNGTLDSLVTADGYRIGYLAVDAALNGTRGRPLQQPSPVGAALLTRQGIVDEENR